MPVNNFLTLYVEKITYLFLCRCDNFLFSYLYLFLTKLLHDREKTAYNIDKMDSYKLMSDVLPGEAAAIAASCASERYLAAVASVS